MNKEITNGRITRWLLLLQEFNITILDRRGKENQVVDFLSRLNNEGENTLLMIVFQMKICFLLLLTPLGL
jgi:energy-coupling factor transporter ATP-binding protein EcfA2